TVEHVSVSEVAELPAAGSEPVVPFPVMAELPSVQVTLTVVLGAHLFPLPAEIQPVAEIIRIVRNPELWRGSLQAGNVQDQSESALHRRFCPRISQGRELPRLDHATQSGMPVELLQHGAGSRPPRPDGSVQNCDRVEPGSQPSQVDRGAHGAGARD